MAASPFSDDATHPLRELLREGRFRAVVEYFEQEAGVELGSRPDAQLLAATAATRLGDLALATTLATAALRRFRARGDADGQMRAYNLLGAVHFERGRLREAEAYFGEALDLACRLDDSLLAGHAFNNLGSVIGLRGRPGEAVGLYRGALSSYQRAGDRRGTAQTYHNLGLAFRQMAEWQEADKAVTQAVRHAEFVGEASLMALTATGRAELRIDQGDIAVAGQELSRASLLAQRAGDAIGAAEVRRISALLALKQGDADLAAAEAEAARATAESHDSALLLAECAALCALAHRAGGRPAEAERRRDEALAGFAALGAARLAERFEAEWSA
jgi:tetratricopeptide (TPR) repeat protein